MGVYDTGTRVQNYATFLDYLGSVDIFFLEVEYRMQVFLRHLNSVFIIVALIAERNFHLTT